jgi:hypothetical protein
VHDRAHGFVAGRSCITGAQIHASEALIATYDLTAFFPSLTAPRIHGIFRTLGYPWAVARQLTGLCTSVTPETVIDRLVSTASDRSALRSIYGVPHLPQGAPSSPALANLLAWRLDQRLHGLARFAGANYTRYADDLAFSGDARFAKSIARFSKQVKTIVDEEGFRLNLNKTRIMKQHGRQQVTGLVVNAHCSVGRATFDRLKAILHNCVKQGPASQNTTGIEDFRRHLEGQVAWVQQVDPSRGIKLRAKLERINWGPIDGNPKRIGA